MTDTQAHTVRIGSMVGDGIGHEIVPATMRVVDAAAQAEHFTVDWVELDLGRDAIDSHGSPVPQPTLDALASLPAWILGPHDSASYPEPFRSQLTPGGVVRKTFDLFANIRPALAHAGVRAVSPKMDLVVVRENTEGFYADRNMHVGSGEFMPTPDVALAVGVLTRTACERIAREAFTLARARRKHVTIVHKANVLSLTTGLFRDVCRSVAEDFPDVVVDEEHVDALTAHLVRRGQDFDVVVAENMFGDILSDLAGELSGSLGMAPSLNSSSTKAMAQAAHGSAPDIAGKNRANPTALFLSAAMLLDWLAVHGQGAKPAQAAHRIRRAVGDTLESGVATADLGGRASTSEFTETVLARTLRV
ncbi:3-isopropylmalate dehydrogenase [Rhodococcoides kyotonense]|uniref:3-isopropylmalate dehydrogenase n=2 Tax=Rhodococcoides kyotonense TaxID=398843 RepID=A0A239KRJ3_9NOCA|nr:3-isopropylmalate dehydrogenase [Rhodococcus kyotonensis]